MFNRVRGRKEVGAKLGLLFEPLEPRTLLAGFMAYNDAMPGPQTDDNATVYADNAYIGCPASGQLKEITTGAYTSVELSTIGVGVSWGGTGTNPATGTNAADVFAGYVDFTSALTPNSIEIAGTGDSYTHIFSNLDWEGTYDFAGTAIRGSSSDDYRDRWTLVTLSGAVSFTAAHSTGDGVLTHDQPEYEDYVGENQVALWTGANHLADQGWIAQWTDIVAGGDNEFSVVSQQYLGPVPTSVDPDGIAGNADLTRGYGLNGVRLIAYVPSRVPTVTNLPPAVVQAFVAQINGELTSTGGEPTNVTMYFGDEDGGTDPESWDNAFDLGQHTGAFSAAVGGLDQTTTYHYRAFAENIVGSVWAPEMTSFTTLAASLPEVVNLPATYVGAYSAWLHGEVTETGNDPPLVIVYYGDEDGGTDSGLWDHSVVLDAQSGAFDALASDLQPETAYYFTAYAQNAVGGVWTTPSLAFETTVLPPLQITEFMADNDTTLTTRTRTSTDDEFAGDLTSPDWIELHNPTDSAVILDGYYLTDNLANPTMWTFPPGTPLEPGGFLVVFASGKDITDPDLDERGYLHTNFKLSSEVEDAALIDPAGTVVHGYEDYPAQSEDISYGVNESNEERFFADPTPGWDNANDVPRAPEFTVASTTFIGSIDVDLVPRYPTDTIHYTDDETLPTAASPVWSGPTTIIDTTMLRALSVGTNGKSSVVDSRAYIELGADLVDDNSDLPILIVETFGDGVPGVGTYFGDVYVAVIEPGGDGRAALTDPFVVDTRGGIHVRGSSSSGFTKKQYRVELWDETNEDRKMELLGMPSEADWIFYGPGQYDRSLIANPLMYDLSNQIDRYATRTRWVEMYLNYGGGELAGSDYYGVYAIMEVIEDGDDRVDVGSLSSGAGGVDVSGGFIWKNDRGSPYVEPELPNTDQRAYIDNEWINPLNNAWPGQHATYAELDSFIDHNLLNMLAMNVDAFRLSGYYFKTEDGKLEAGPIWDFDRSLESTDGRDDNPLWWNGTGDSTLFFNDGSRVMNWWPRMFQDRDFVQMYIDRWFELREDQFSLDDIFATIDAHAAELAEAAPRDYARWYSARHGGFAGEIQHLKDWLTSRINWVDSQWVQRPEPSVAGPVVTPGTSVTLSLPVGQTGNVYYTLDGTDPRVSGGGIKPGAIPGSVPFTVNEYTKVTARIYKSGHLPSSGEPGYISTGDDWSAPIALEYFVNLLVAPGDLAITEINYHPIDATIEELGTQPPEDPDFEDNDFEFIEFENVSGHTVNICGVTFKDGINFTFDSHVLADGERIVVAEDLDGFTARYGDNGSLEGTGITLAGSWLGELSNKGEQLTVVGRDDFTLLDFAYDDDGGWPNRADGGGSSLELEDSSAVPSTPTERTAFLQDPDNWRSSVDYNGSPSEAGTEPSVTVLINEVLAHSDLPYYDRIELYNASGAPVDIAGWFLSDSSPNYFKFAIPPDPLQGDERWLEADGEDSYVWFDENDFNPTGIDGDPDTNDLNDFALSSFGDDVWLLSADADGNPDLFIDRVEFDATSTNVSLGRLPNGNPDSDLLPLAGMSFGAANTTHRVGEVIIGEVHYNPDGPDAEREFLELYNNTGAPLDLSFWRISDAVDILIPETTALGIGEAVVLVDFDPGDSGAAGDFRAAYGIGTGVQLVGPWDPDDSLDNGGEKITLQRRNPELEPGESAYTYITVDQVDYDDDSPWPDADATDKSLTRLTADVFGNDYTSWAAEDPTPGSAFGSLTPHVVGRHVFYNNSAFDNDGPGPDPADDNAIDHDKVALVPGQTATFANYTSYSRGINGIMVDVQNFPTGYTPVADDFTFMVGNNDDPGSWTQAPNPTITVREPDGPGGPSRVTLIWPDNAIRQQWIEVTVKAGPPIGLTTMDVFYFGNAVAEAGNLLGDAQVTTTDLLLARNNPRNYLNEATIDFNYDYNRDKRVNSTDVLLARNNQTNFLTWLKLIDLSSPEAAAAPSASPEPLAWLYGFDEMQRSQDSSRKADPTKEGVDQLLTLLAE